MTKFANESENTMNELGYELTTNALLTNEIAISAMAH